MAWNVEVSNEKDFSRERTPGKRLRKAEVVVRQLGIRIAHNL
jgi:hypothetical protein